MPLLSSVFSAVLEFFKILRLSCLLLDHAGLNRFSSFAQEFYWRCLTPQGFPGVAIRYFF